MKYIFVKGIWTNGEFYENRQQIDLDKLPDILSKVDPGTYRIVVYDESRNYKTN